MEAINLLLVFDAVLGLTLLWLAWQAMTSPDLFRGIVLFIAFGLLMAMAWVRLDAPDVALAEATIGAGLTGALLLAALAGLGADTNSTNENTNDKDKSDVKASSMNTEQNNEDAEKNER